MGAAARAWFRSERCRDAVRRKVANMYPAHEVDEFSARFFALVQQSVAAESGGAPAVAGGKETRT